jgi:rhodanese-related sulfurtransferase
MTETRNEMSNTTQIQPAAGYAGDVPAELAWQWLQAGEAVLVDVRTDAEREWVGKVPGAVAVAWKQWPGMAANQNFDAELRAAVPKARKWCCYAAAVCALLRQPSVLRAWESRPTTFLKVSKATLTPTANEASWVAGASAACPGISKAQGLACSF